MAVVDAHCHTSPYWYEPVESFLDQMDRIGVDKATLVAITEEYDNSYLLDCMRRFPGRFSVVATVDISRPDAPNRLEEWVKQGVEGIRLRPNAQSPGRDPLAIWRKANELGIVVSAQGSELRHFASPEFETVIKEFPNLTFIMEHLGGGKHDTTPPHDLYRKVLALAHYPNTFMKVSPFGEFCSRSTPFGKPFPFRNVPPLIEMAIEAFGAKRLMWGSDFPPVSGREGYRNSLRFLLEHVSFKGDEDKEWVFGRTADTLFRFGE
jgi:L-fuconolactonase